jgi:5-methyltetrahydrofolate--homocysteine methyltransferase
VLCATVDAEGRLETGEAIEALAEGVAGFPLHGLGLNCALNGRAARAPLAALAGRTAARLWLYPNAGYPDRDGRYDETPVETAAALQDLAREGLVDVVGGCCGTTPAHIAALAAALAGLTARHAR